MAVSKEKVDKISDRLYNKPPTTNIRAETPEQRFKGMCRPAVGQK